ncbi:MULTISPECIES: hypothetical protein [Psychrobacter]|uniref:hypothetical protein n=1 Tax=Psychrobacter TaxID=497 RepID=UPI00146D5860|nr:MULTISPECIES: hypothetical protein [Psychrobacter]
MGDGNSGSRKRAAFYLAEANRLGYANLAKNDSDYLTYYRDDHECAILGRMFGLTDVVAEAEHLDTPRIANNLSDNEVIKLFAAGRTLEAWIAQANHALSQTKAQRVQYWNDNCAGSGKFKFAPSLLLTTIPSFSNFPTKTIKSKSNAPTQAKMPDFKTPTLARSCSTN